MLEIPCETHKERTCTLTCSNDYCKNFRLFCVQCLKEKKHYNHNDELEEISKMALEVNLISKQCDDLLLQFQNLLDTTQQKMNQLKRALKKELINLLSINFLNEQISTELVNFNMLLEKNYRELNLREVSYFEISDQDVTQAKVYLKEGGKLQDKKNFQEAIEVFDKSLDLNPKDPKTLGYQGECLRMLGKLDESLKQLNKALEIDQKEPYFLCSKGACLLSLGKFQEAILLFEKALEINPNDEFALTHKKLCQEKIRNCKENDNKYIPKLFQLPF